MVQTFGYRQGKKTPAIATLELDAQAKNSGSGFSNPAPSLPLENQGQGPTIENLGAAKYAGGSGKGTGDADTGATGAEWASAAGTVISGLSNAYSAYSGAEEARKMRKQAEREYKDYIQQRNSLSLALGESARRA